MNSNDFTVQRSMIFDDVHDLFRYKFWHFFVDDCLHRFRLHLGTPLVLNSMFWGDRFCSNCLNRFLIDL